MLSCLFRASGLEARGQQVLAKRLTGVCVATNPGQLDPDLLPGYSPSGPS